MPLPELDLLRRRGIGVLTIAGWGCTAALLLIGATIVVTTNYKQIQEVYIFALVLLVQSLPFLAAVAVAAIEGSRFNEFAYWRRMEAKMVDTLPRPADQKSAISNQ